MAVDLCMALLELEEMVGQTEQTEQVMQQAEVILKHIVEEQGREKQRASLRTQEQICILAVVAVVFI